MDTRQLLTTGAVGSKVAPRASPDPLPDETSLMSTTPSDGASSPAATSIEFISRSRLARSLPFSLNPLPPLSLSLSSLITYSLLYARALQGSSHTSPVVGPMKKTSSSMTKAKLLRIFAAPVETSDS